MPAHESDNGPKQSNLSAWVPFLPLRAKAYKGGNLAKLWSILSGRGAIIHHIWTFQSCWNFTHRQLRPFNFKLWPLSSFDHSLKLGKSILQQVRWKFNELKNQMRFSIFCHRPNSTPNLQLPQLGWSVIGPKLAKIILKSFENQIELKQIRFSFLLQAHLMSRFRDPSDLLLGPNWLLSSHDSHLFHFLLNSNWLLASFVAQWFNAIASPTLKNTEWHLQTHIDYRIQVEIQIQTRAPFEHWLYTKCI